MRLATTCAAGSSGMTEAVDITENAVVEMLMPLACAKRRFAGGGAAFVFATDAAKVGAGTTGSEGRRNENAPGVHCCLPPDSIGVGTYGPPKFNGRGEVGPAAAEFREEAIAPKLAAARSRDARHARCGLRQCLGKTAAEVRRIGAGECGNPYR